MTFLEPKIGFGFRLKINSRLLPLSWHLFNMYLETTPFTKVMQLGAVHKKRPHSGRYFRCGRPYFLVEKTSDISKFMVCPFE